MFKKWIRKSRLKRYDKFLNDEYDLNDAIESDSDTDFDSVKIIR